MTATPGDTEDQLVETSAGNSGLQNLGDGWYQFNWKAPSSYANSCKVLKRDPGEAAPRPAYFNFTK